MKKIKSDETLIDVFKVKYSLYEKQYEGNILYEVVVDDILIGDISIKNSLNDKFNTYKSSFCRTLQFNIEQKENIYVSISGGLSGYYDD
jgi:hypothetical protein